MLDGRGWDLLALFRVGARLTKCLVSAQAVILEYVSRYRRRGALSILPADRGLDTNTTSIHASKTGHSPQHPTTRTPDQTTCGCPIQYQITRGIPSTLNAIKCDHHERISTETKKDILAKTFEPSATACKTTVISIANQSQPSAQLSQHTPAIILACLRPTTCL